MNRYADMDKVYDAVMDNVDADCCNGEQIKEECLREILFAHEVNVSEVVRCHNCAYCKYDKSSLIYKCNRLEYFSEEVDPNDFCSRGKVKAR